MCESELGYECLHDGCQVYRSSYPSFFTPPSFFTHSPTSTSTMDTPSIILRSIDGHLKCPITFESMVDPVVLCDGTVYERKAIRHHLAKQRVDRKAPTSPLTNQLLYVVRAEGEYGAEDEDARYYSPICVVKNVCEDVRPHLPSEGGEEEEEGLPADVASIKKSERNRKQSLAKLNQASWLEAKRVVDFFLANKAANQPTAHRPEHERLEGPPPALPPHTIIALGSDMVPLRECMDGKLFNMSMGTFDVWLLLFSKLSHDDTRAFLRGDMTFYGAKHKVIATGAGAPSYQERQERGLKGLVNTLQENAAKKNTRIKKCLAMLRKVKDRLATAEGEVCLYEALVAVLRGEDEA